MRLRNRYVVAGETDRGGIDRQSTSRCYLVEAATRKATSLAAWCETTRLSDRNHLAPRNRTLHHETSRRHDHRRHPHVTGKSTHLPANTHILNRPQGTQ